MSVSIRFSGSDPESPYLDGYGLADEILRLDPFQMDVLWARQRLVESLAATELPWSDWRARTARRRSVPGRLAAGSIIAPRRANRGWPARRAIRLAAAFAFVLVALAAVTSAGALTGSGTGPMAKVIDVVPNKIQNWAQISSDSVRYKKRPRRRRDENQAAILVQEIVDSLEARGTAVLARHGVQDLPPGWLTPEYLTGPSGWSSLPRQLRSRIAFAAEAELEMPSSGALDDDVGRRYAQRGLRSASILVFTSEGLHAWRARRSTEWREIDAHARAALELHAFLVEHEGQFHWDAQAEILVHPDPETTRQAGRLLAPLASGAPLRPHSRSP